MKILVIKTSALGDIIHCFPVLAYLRSKFPEAQIDWVVEGGFASLIQAHPAINNVLTVDTKRWRKAPWSLQEIATFRRQLRQHTYDVIFDLQGNVKSGLILSQAKGKEKVGFGWKQVPEWPNGLFTNKKFETLPGRNIREDYLSIVQSYFDDPHPFEDNGVLLTAGITSPQKLKDTVMVCPGSAWPNKQMSEEALHQFLSRVQKKLDCRFLFVWGTEGEREVAERLHEWFKGCSSILDRQPLPMLQNIMAQVQLVIAMDSLPLHLAGTTATPTFSIFGASSAAKYKPQGAQHHSYQGACPYGRTFEKRCPILRSCKTGACIRSLTGDEVFELFE